MPNPNHKSPSATTTTLSKSTHRLAQTLTSLLPQIPAPILREAHGLAIFTVVRGGMWVGGSAGSGVLVARLGPEVLNGDRNLDSDHDRNPDLDRGSDGDGAGAGAGAGESKWSWSPPSAFSISGGSAGLVLGVDHVECVAVLCSRAAVKAYVGDKGAVLGAGAEGSVGTLGGRMVSGAAGKGEDKNGKKAVYMYTKTRGLYGGVTVEGTVVRVRQEANEEFYGEKGITVERILRGDVKAGRDGETGVWPKGAEKLMVVLERAAGAGAGAAPAAVDAAIAGVGK